MPRTKLLLNEEGVFSSLAFLMSAFLIEVYAGYMWTHSHEMAFVVHSAALLMCVCFLGLQMKKGKDARWPAFFLIGVSITGPFGAFGALVAMAFYSAGRKKPGAFMDWYSTLFSEIELEESKVMYERIAAGLERTMEKPDVEPFYDILAFGNLAQKREMLAKIVRHFTPALSPIIRKALEDKDSAVRVQAATILAKLDRDYMQRYLQSEKECMLDSKHAEKQAAAAMNYAASGISGTLNEKIYREKARTIYAALLEDVKGNAVACSKADLAMGDLYYHSGGIEKALFHFERYYSANGAVIKHIPTGFAEALCQSGNYKRLREIIACNPDKHHGFDALPPTLRSVA